ncbi:MAG TPA: hypothetical protein PK263_04880 [bacterium]|nr:hypothetical protein [bacterium]
MTKEDKDNVIQNQRGPRNDSAWGNPKEIGALGEASDIYETEEKLRRVGLPADEEEGGVSNELGIEAEIDESSSDVTDTED